jgi:hypothetical protein
MRKFIALLAATCSIMLGLVVTAPAQANAPVVTSVASPASASSAQVERDSKMGGLPAQNVICAANGVGSSYPQLEYAVEHWNDTNYGALRLSVLNRCDGYSITNRMTIEGYFDATTTCGKFTNLGKAWDSVQGKYIYNQNPIVWVNLSDYCVGTDTAEAHWFQMLVGYILGLNYVNTSPYRVMCYTAWCIGNIKYVTFPDIQDMAAVYGLAA